MKKANFTVAYQSDEEIFAFELWLRQQLEVTDFKLLSDTTDLYKDDSTFRELCMKVKAANRVKNDYINKHNFGRDTN